MRTLIPLLLAACATEPESLPSTQAAPPPVITLAATVFQPGQPFSLSVSGAPAGAQVTFVRSGTGTGPGPCHPASGVCAGITAPLTVIGTATAGAGNVTITLTPPAGVTGSQWFQALASQPGTRNAVISNIVQRIPNDADLDLADDNIDNCPVTPNPSQTDADQDGYGAACDCDDTDADTSPASIDQPGNFVDEDCDGAPFAPWAGGYDGTITGSVTYFGVTQTCTGPITIDIDDADPSQAIGSGSCAAPFYGILPFDLEGEVVGYTLVGTISNPTLGTSNFNAPLATAGGTRSMSLSGAGNSAGVTFTYSAWLTETP